jgi:poly-beta-hydroxyalkanoate depolymerase
LIYAAQFPGKVRKLVLAGAPIDIAAGNSRLSEIARNTPSAIFKELVELGGGRVLGQHALQFWAPNPLEPEAIQAILQSAHAIDSAAFQRMERRFRAWYSWTVDLPGVFYLQVVERLFKENCLAGGNFFSLGRPVDLSRLRCPVFLLAASDDEIVAPEQIFATERQIDARQCKVSKRVAPCGHLGLFMGRNTLTGLWPQISDWLLH